MSKIICYSICYVCLVISYLVQTKGNPFGVRVLTVINILVLYAVLICEVAKDL